MVPVTSSLFAGSPDFQPGWTVASSCQLGHGVEQHSDAVVTERRFGNERGVGTPWRETGALRT
jgi:hypothetical protein